MLIGQANISVPVDTSQVASQIPVSTTFKDASGVWWQVSGTLTVKPIPAPATTGELPLATDLILPYPGPSFGQVFNIATGEPASELRPGDRFLLQGHNFGADPGQLWINYSAAPVFAWLDNAITSQVSATEPAHGLRSTLTVLTVANGHVLGSAFRIVP